MNGVVSSLNLEDRSLLQFCYQQAIFRNYVGGYSGMIASGSGSKLVSDGTEHIKIGELGHGPHGERFVELTIYDKTVVARIDEWGDEEIARLNRHNAHLISPGARRAFTIRLQAKRSDKPGFKVATQLGLHGSCFILPTGIIGRCKKLRVYLDDPENTLSKYRSKGSLKCWTKMARLARGNPRCQLVLALAFVGPIGSFIGVEQVAVQLVGHAASGKTTLAKLAGSVWGRHVDRGRAASTGFGETWNNTLNKLEPMTSSHNHIILILDETRQVSTPRSQKVADAVMRFERGVPKGRLTERAGPGWWVPVLSTSNLSLHAMAREDGVVVDDAHRGRLLDVPNPSESSVFQDLHGCADVATLSARIEKQTSARFGTAGPAFAKALCAWLRRDRAGCRSWIQDRRREFRNRAKRIAKSHECFSRAEAKFSTIYAAGCVAIKFGILPFSRAEFRRSLLSCLQAHVTLIEAERPSPKTIPAVLMNIIQHVALNKEQFVDLRKGPIQDNYHNHAACHGYVANVGREIYYMFSHEIVTRITGSKKAAQAAKLAFAERGAILRDPNGRFAVKQQLVAGRARHYVVAIKAAAFEDGAS